MFVMSQNYSLILDKHLNYVLIYLLSKMKMYLVSNNYLGNSQPIIFI